MSTTELEERIGHRFADPELLRRALTHSSVATEREAGREVRSEPRSTSDDYETLEFLGDAVLGLVVAEELYTRHPHSHEGALTQMKHQLVSAKAFEAIARELGLGEALLLGTAEEKSGGRDKSALISDAFEAVVGAVFLDGGYPAARDVTLKLFGERVAAASPADSVDFKSLLQERLQGAGFPLPEYRTTKEEGPPHDRTFHVRVSWQGGTAEAEGRTKKAAEIAAAELALAETKDLDERQ